ncbi:zinc dependent phospholipase C family protein [Flavihumibacter sp. R14]|nr:zinc dependent phospholipase C family protein [Flavihumibacter soli]
MSRTLLKALLSLFFINFLSLNLSAYSLLTHEAIIDLSWKRSIEPSLLEKYPNSSAEQLLQAHSFAYGGAIMPDIGYSPFGSMIYTDFVHNVRTGDYVVALIEEAETLDEYAFALGSLAHYLADNNGHLLGTNVSVPLVYPKIKLKFGNTVTYAQDKLSHSRMEFGFDVLQIARGNYASKAYHDFIGFNIAKPVIEKAFYRTYGIAVNDVFSDFDVAISTYRWTIKSLLPNIVRTGWAKKKSEIRKLQPDATARSFSYRMKNRMYYQEFGKHSQKTGFFQSIIARLIPVLPKIGPLAKLKFKTPTPEAEQLFIRSFDTTLVKYDQAIASLHKGNEIHLQNKTLDTGHQTVWGEYPIADENYETFLLMHSEKKFENVNQDVKTNLILFFKSSNPPKNSESRKNWIAISRALSMLNQQMEKNGI